MYLTMVQPHVSLPIVVEKLNLESCPCPLSCEVLCYVAGECLLGHEDLIWNK